VKPETREEFQDLVYAAGLSEEDIRWDYSGRGMYGRECVGLTCSESEMFGFIGEVARATEDDDWDWVKDVRSDSMGLDTIWYWPNVSVEEEDDA